MISPDIFTEEQLREQAAWTRRLSVRAKDAIEERRGLAISYDELVDLSQAYGLGGSIVKVQGQKGASFYLSPGKVVDTDPETLGNLISALVFVNNFGNTQYNRKLAVENN